MLTLINYLLKPNRFSIYIAHRSNMQTLACITSETVILKTCFRFQFLKTYREDTYKNINTAEIALYSTPRAKRSSAGLSRIKNCCVFGLNTVRYDSNSKFGEPIKSLQRQTNGANNLIGADKLSRRAPFLVYLMQMQIVVYLMMLAPAQTSGRYCNTCCCLRHQPVYQPHGNHGYFIVVRSHFVVRQVAALVVSNDADRPLALVTTNFKLLDYT